MNGWIKTYRQIQKHWIWQAKEPYDKRSAWQYILLQAFFKDEKTMWKGSLIDVKRGQFPTSIRTLSDAWMWSTGKVSRFIDKLKAEHMIETERIENGTLVTVVNYGFYQDERNSNETLTDTPIDTPTKQQRDSNKTLTRQQQDTDETATRHNIRNKEDEEDEERKECKEREEVITAPTETVNRSDIQSILKAWNELERYGIKAVAKLKSGTDRYDRLTARIKEYSVEDALTAIENIKRSNFLQGKNDRGWTITFDWFVRPNNFPKVLDGNYSNKDTQNASTSFVGGSRDEQFQRLMEQIRRDEESDS